MRSWLVKKTLPSIPNQTKHNHKQAPVRGLRSPWTKVHTRLALVLLGLGRGPNVHGEDVR
jgi:hypothetical protein